MYPTLLTNTVFEESKGKEEIPYYQRPVTPSSFTSSASSISSIYKPTYHSIIEDNETYIVSQISSFIKDITRDVRTHDNVRIINNYAIQSSLGKGQFGKVYKAVSIENNNNEGRVVAIKVIPKKPMNSQQFSMNQILRQLQIWKNKGIITSSNSISSDQTVILMNLQKCRWELFVLSKLDNPYITKMIECLDSPNSKNLWIVNEWGNLGELQWKRDTQPQILEQWEPFLEGCNKRDFISFSEKVLLDITKGLKYLKSQGCIHRDIKPSNILVDSIGKKFKISDFGCSIIIPSELFISNPLLKSAFQLELHKIVGTPAFIAPELCYSEDLTFQDNIDDGFQLDIWALGVTLYCLLYNDLPFYGDNEFETYNKISSETLHHKLNGNYLNDLVIGKILEKDPSKRIKIEELYSQIFEKYETDVINIDEKNPVLRVKSKTKMKNFFSKLKNFKPSIQNNTGDYNSTPNTTTEVPFNNNIRNNNDVTTKQTVLAGPNTNFSKFEETPYRLSNDSSASSMISSLGSHSTSSSLAGPVKIPDLLDSLKSQSPNDYEAHNNNNDNHKTVIDIGLYTDDDIHSMKELNTPSRHTRTRSTVSLIEESPSKPLQRVITQSPLFSKSEELLPSIAYIQNSPLRKVEKKPLPVSRGIAHSKNIIDFRQYLDSEDDQNEKQTMNGGLTSDSLSDIKNYLAYLDKNLNNNNT
ncbi:hypothetical protein Kpol_185p2 [Vanderwaltozyma polyspora DSM 70294]|uniref:Protein kinase domain-containing protein n=1 Tax=Vanderwaltozyma polyspora (strain ATCC 22028 / DSM 70294 / BCRC 21397 / CBS 2163 / NBRC 10782 / NRRL Y-8283 / UCD 57-17) TaxID=436907 RepID=A7TTK8_VANPO|nr:uncharacterized protein Kpol_185p2 [Vanderwaltozyma polyspora DSM 70294]EDO14399.1 hypothetical protein Kpol_185p2 [Vanderwaltozyma polyspora DSM 70294]